MKKLSSIIVLTALLACIATVMAGTLSYTTPLPQTGDSALVIANKVAVGQAALANGNSYSNITTAATTTVKSGAGVLDRLVINTGGTGSTATIYDNTAASGTKIATLTTATQGTILYNVRFGTGLTVVTASGTPADLTVSYR